MWQKEREDCFSAARQTISEMLKTAYEPVVQEPLPDVVTALLERLALADDDRAR
jgi:hypothetical protein